MNPSTIQTSLLNALAHGLWFASEHRNPKTSYFFLFFLLFPFALSAQSEYQQIDRYLALIRSEYSGENAYATTKFVGKYWRLPGNTGFNASIDYVKNLLEQAGYEAADKPDLNRMTYRVESRPLGRPAWEPVDAQVQIVGDAAPLLQFATNRNMLAINSFSTQDDGFTGEVIHVTKCDDKSLANLDLKGKIVFGECHAWPLFSVAVKKFGAAGVLAYRIPSYNQPEKHTNSISFSSIPFNSDHQSWAVNLSFAAKERLLAALAKGTVELQVDIQTKFQAAEELTLIAEIPGQIQAEERFVFSAHVQEPGANDNASGVGAQGEMARVAATLFKKGQVKPARSITFIWGDEIRATRRYIQEDEARAADIRWGMSLDMVGEDTEKTGGTFLIEKMPDPSAVWTRGEDQHTEWGATPVNKTQLKPHYFNDMLEAVCHRQAMANNWVVKTNPFEGGSDHQPFLDAGIPGLLLWHFTDVYYHTDADRIDKVSPQTLANVGTSALASAYLLASGSESTATEVLRITETAGRKRLAAELALSAQELRAGKAVAKEKDIIETWTKWYVEALPTVSDITVNGPSKSLQNKIRKAVKGMQKRSQKGLKKLAP